MSTRRVDLTTGSVIRHVWRMTPPMMLAFFAMSVFNLTDTWFVSMLGTTPLAAMGFTFPIVMVVHSIAMGIGLGVSSCVSRAIGAQDQARVRHLTTYSLYLTIAVMSLLTLAGLAVLPMILRSIGAEGNALRLAKEYLVTWFLFVPLASIPMVGNNAIRATGDTLRPSIIMSVAALVNVVLDPVMIFGLGFFPAMGMRGAALATGISQLISLVWAVWVMHRRCHLLDFDWTGFRDMVLAWGNIFHIALPSAGTNILMPVSMGVVMRFIAAHGEAAVAATAAGQRIEHFAYLLPMAMGSTLVPIMGQNWGAGLIDRVRRVWVATNWYGIAYGAICLALAFPLARPLGGFFSNDPDVICLISHYLPIMLTGAIFLHVFVHTSFAFNAIKKPISASVLLIIRCGVLLVPLTRIGGRLLGVEGIYAGMAVTTVTSGLIALLWFRATLRRLSPRVCES